MGLFFASEFRKPNAPTLNASESGTTTKNAKGENAPSTLAFCDGSSGFPLRTEVPMKKPYPRSKVNFGRISRRLKEILKLALLILELFKKFKDL
jgi:hypothetical protein